MKGLDCPSNYVWSPDGGAGQPGWTRKWVSLWRNITLTIYSPGLLLAFTNNFTNSGSSLEIIFLTTNFRENISDVIIQSLNLEPTYSIDKCIHSIHIHWCQIIFSRKTFFISEISFPGKERNPKSEIELISLHYSSVLGSFLLMLRIIQGQGLKLLRTWNLSKHGKFFIDHKRYLSCYNSNNHKYTC